MGERHDCEDRLQALYRLRENVVENIAVEDDASRAIVAAVDSLIDECQGARPSGSASKGASGREAL